MKEGVIDILGMMRQKEGLVCEVNKAIAGKLFRLHGRFDTSVELNAYLLLGFRVGWGIIDNTSGFESYDLTAGKEKIFGEYSKSSRDIPFLRPISEKDLTPEEAANLKQYRALAQTDQRIGEAAQAHHEACKDATLNYPDQRKR